jgi:hypothetical protein
VLRIHDIWCGVDPDPGPDPGVIGLRSEGASVTVQLGVVGSEDRTTFLPVNV